MRPEKVDSKRHALLGIAGVVSFVVLWEVAGLAGWINVGLFSDPSQIVIAAIHLANTGQLWTDIRGTLVTFFWAYAISVVVGIPIGFVMGWSRLARHALDPFVWFLYASPKVAFYPLLIIFVGFGRPTAVVLGLMLAVFPIIANTLTGVKTVDPALLRAARSFGAGVPAIFSQVILPASVPFVAAGLRLAVGRAFVGILVGELFGGNSGLGFRMAQATVYLRMNNYFVALVALVILSLAFTVILGWLEKRASRWRGA